MNNVLVYAQIDKKEFGLNPIPHFIDSVSNYFPLDIGNTWIFRKTISFQNLAETAYIQRKILADTILNGIVYKKIEEINLSTRKKIFTLYRMDSSNGNFFLENKIQDNFLVNKIYTLFSNQSLMLKEISRDTILNLATIVRSLDVWRNSGWYGKNKYALTLGMCYESTILKLNPDSIETSVLIYANIKGAEYDSNPLSVNDEQKNIPTEFLLYQNYPNPFNPTTIQYSIPNVGTHENASPKKGTSFQTFLRVYDVLGKEIATLVSEQQKAGTHSIQFSASALASCIYFYELHAGNFVERKKMILLR